MICCLTLQLTFEFHLETMHEPVSTGTPRAWGAACGMLAFSAITLFGVATGFAHETILLRSCVGGAVVGVTVAVACAVIGSVRPPDDDD